MPAQTKSQASVQLAGGVPFLSDAALQDSLATAGVPQDVSDQVVAENQKARIAGLDAALAVLGLIALVALLSTGRIPEEQAASMPDTVEV